MNFRVSHFGLFAVGAVLGSILNSLRNRDNRQQLSPAPPTEREVNEIFPSRATDSQSQEIVGDRVLINRVRKAFRGEIRRPKDLHVSANQGEVTLYGNIDRNELAALISRVENVPGVRRLVNSLKILDAPTSIDVQSESDLRH